MKESLEAIRLRAEHKDEKNECSFHKLLVHRCQTILNASAQPPFLESAENPTSFYESVLAEKLAFRAKQLIDHVLSVSSMKRFKVSPALVASIWIRDLITNELTPSNLSIWFCPERTYKNSKESDFKRSLWIMDGKHVCFDIHILSKTSIYVPDGIMDTYFMLFNF
jgi:hypothetical protein